MRYLLIAIAFFLLIGFASITESVINIDSCSLLNESGEYLLTQNITADVGGCMNITADDVLLECDGNRIISNTSGIFMAGIQNAALYNCDLSASVAFEGMANVIILNMTINSSSAGLSAINGTGWVVDNLIVHSNQTALALVRVNESQFRNLNLSSYDTGILLDGSSTNTFASMDVDNLTNTCVDMRSTEITESQTARNIVNDSYFYCPVSISFSGFAEQIVNNTFYNNFFRNIRNINSTDFGESSPQSNYWNVELRNQTNIVGKSYVGGNYWSSFSNDGYSDSCSVNENYTCSLFVLAENNTDYFPLGVQEFAIDAEVLSLEFISPTPENDARTIENQATINVSVQSTQELRACILEWLGVNETMEKTGSICSAVKQTTDGWHYSYKVFAYANNSDNNSDNNSNDNSNNSISQIENSTETRVVMENSPPFGNISSSVSGFSNEPINCSFIIVDAENDSIEYTYFWYKNNELYSQGNGRLSRRALSESSANEPNQSTVSGSFLQHETPLSNALPELTPDNFPAVLAITQASDSLGVFSITPKVFLGNQRAQFEISGAGPAGARPILFLNLSNYTLSLNFSRPVIFDVNSTLTFFGKTYLIDPFETNLSSGNEKIILKSDYVAGRFNSGETSTIIVNGSEISVEVIGINTQSSTPSATIRINDSAASLSRGESRTLGGQQVYLNDVFTYAQPVGGGGAELFFSYDILILENRQNVRAINSINGTAASLQQESGGISGISIVVSPDNIVYEKENSAEQVFGSFIWRFSEAYPSLESPLRTMMLLNATDENRLQLSFRSKTGLNHTLDFIRGYSNESGSSKIGLFYGNSAIHINNNEPVFSGEYFILGNSTHQNLLKLVSIQNSQSIRELRIRDEGNSITSAWTFTDNYGSMNYDGNGYDFNVTAAEDSSNSYIILDDGIVDYFITDKNNKIEFSDFADTAVQPLSVVVSELTGGANQNLSHGALNISIKYTEGRTGNDIYIDSINYVSLQGDQQMSEWLLAEEQGYNLMAVTPFGTLIKHNNNIVEGGSAIFYLYDMSTDNNIQIMPSDYEERVLEGTISLANTVSATVRAGENWSCLVQPDDGFEIGASISDSFIISSRIIIPDNENATENISSIANFENFSIIIGTSEFANLTSEIDSSSEGIELVAATKNGLPVLEFEYNFSEPLNFSELRIEAQANSSILGAVAVRGLNINITKTAFVDNLSASTGVCIIDMAEAEISQFTQSCTGPNETWLACPGNSSQNNDQNNYQSNTQYSCEYNATLNKFRISGLAHSAVQQQQTYCGDGIANGGETCSSCPADVGACQSSGDGGGNGSGGSGGGGSSGGGGGGSSSSNNSFAVKTSGNTTSNISSMGTNSTSLENYAGVNSTLNISDIQFNSSADAGLNGSTAESTGFESTELSNSLSGESDYFTADSSILKTSDELRTTASDYVSMLSNSNNSTPNTWNSAITGAAIVNTPKKGNKLVFAVIFVSAMAVVIAGLAWYKLQSAR